MTEKFWIILFKNLFQNLTHDLRRKCLIQFLPIANEYWMSEKKPKRFDIDPKTSNSGQLWKGLESGVAIAKTKIGKNQIPKIQLEAAEKTLCYNSRDIDSID